MGEAKAKKAEPKKDNNDNNQNQKKNLKSAAKEKKEVAKKDVAKETARKAPAVKKDSAGPLWPRVKGFFKGAVRELKKVHWPSRQQIIAFTAVVIVSVLFMAALIWVVDSGLTQLIKLVLKK